MGVMVSVPEYVRRTILGLPKQRKHPNMPKKQSYEEQIDKNYDVIKEQASIPLQHHHP
jgi:hypothetical protein